MYSINLIQAKWLGYHLRKYVASPLLIHLQQGQAYMKVYEPNYLHAKSPVELNKKEAATTAIISSPPKTH